MKATREKKQGMNWCFPTTRLAIYHRDGFRCAYCGATLEGGATLTLDHLTAVNRGGTNKATNLITACLSCNSAKQDRLLSSFGEDNARRIRNQARRSLKTSREWAREFLKEVKTVRAGLDRIIAG